MNAAEILGQLDKLGCYLQVVQLEPPKLRLFDYADKTTPELRKHLVAQKADLVRLVCERTRTLIKREARPLISDK